MPSDSFFRVALAAPHIFKISRRINMADCSCGRSPTGKCVGWHGLSEQQYQEKKSIHDAKQKSKAVAE